MHWEFELLLIYIFAWLALLVTGGLIADYLEQRARRKREKLREKLYNKVLDL